MKPIIDHIQITVKNLKFAEEFYDKLMPLLGFDIHLKENGVVLENEFEVVEYYHPLLTFAINSPRELYKEDLIHRRKPGALHHLAFKAESKQELDKLYLKVKEIGADIVDKPQYYPQHGDSYYALFFKDLEGIKYEIVFEEQENLLII